MLSCRLQCCCCLDNLKHICSQYGGQLALAFLDVFWPKALPGSADNISWMDLCPITSVTSLFACGFVETYTQLKRLQTNKMIT